MVIKKNKRNTVTFELKSKSQFETKSSRCGMRLQKRSTRITSVIRKNFGLLLSEIIKEVQNLSLLFEKMVVTVTSTQGKLNILKQHYERLGNGMVESSSCFDENWKAYLETEVDNCSIFLTLKKMKFWIDWFQLLKLKDVFSG